MRSLEYRLSRSMRSARTPATLLAALLFLAAVPDAATAQKTDETSLEVVVSDLSGRPLQDAEVTLRELGLTALTDTAGRLELLRLPSGPLHLVVNLFGFASDSAMVRIRAGRGHMESFALEEQPIPIEGIDVTVEDRSEQLDVLRGFRERRERGLGYFLTRAEIEDSGTKDLSNLLHMVPGLRTTPSQFGQSEMRAARTPVTRQCHMKVYMDGMRYRNPGDVVGIPTADIQAIEVYRSRSELPAQFADLDTNCGAIVIWTRRFRERL